MESHYHTPSYDSKRRFISYWHQIDEIISRTPKKILEVGIGNGFVTGYLRSKNFDVVTCDSDETLKPDVVGSITQLPFKNGEFDVVAAYEILEHLPYEEMLEGLRELIRVSSAFVIVSVPDTTRVFRLELPIPKIGKFKKLLIVPKKNMPAHIMGEEGHFWEIGKHGYKLKRIERDIRSTGVTIEKTFRVFENPYHRFFVLKKHR